MEIRLAAEKDLDGVMTLLKKYHVNSINPAEKADGFVTTNLTPQQLEDLALRERGVTVAVRDGAVVAFALAASWQFWSEWPLFQHMMGKLPEHELQGRTITVDNSYQYGPICVDGSVRGSGVFQQVFHASLESMAARYPIMVTFINQLNPRSYAAHTRKTPLEVVGTFQFNQNDYYMLACPTKAQ